MTHDEIVKALHNLAPTSEWTLSGDSYSDLEWLSNDKKPTLAEIETEIAAIPSKEAALKLEEENNRAALLAKLGITADEAKLLLS
jgi:hypothetical protein